MDVGIEALLRAGRYAEALAQAEAAGRLDWCRAIHRRRLAWDDAARTALEAGDRLGALEDLLDGGRTDRASALAHELAAEGAAAAGQVAARVDARAPGLAGALRERAGDHAGAARSYRRAGALVDAGRMLEAEGKLHEAGAAWEDALRREPEGPDAQRARLGLAGLLERVGRPHDAAARLQDAARGVEGPARAEPLRRLAALLARTGLLEASREVLRDLRTVDPEAPADPLALTSSSPDRGSGAPGAGETTLLGRWRVRGELGVGATGRVVRAWDEVLGREVALKLIAPSASSPQAVARFAREARLLGGLDHPNVVRLIEARPEAGLFAMELCEGTLERELRPRVAPARLVAIALDVVAALEAAHVRGIVHRDVKPANVLLDAGGRAKLGDFGAAHLVDLGATQTGGLIGTLAYMAPEQITAADVTWRTDLYGLGATLFHALTGRLAFPGPDFVAQHLGDAAPAPSAFVPDLLPAWDALLAALLAKAPGDRPAALDDVRRALHAARPAPAIALRLSASARRREGDAPGGGGEVGAPAATAAMGVAGERVGPRFHGETALDEGPGWTAARAVDAVLGRTVILERYAEGYPDAATFARLAGLAHAGGPELQRVLAWRPSERLLVLEAPVGAPLVPGELPPAGAADAIALAVARCLARLHAAGATLGQLSRSRVVWAPGAGATVLVSGLGAAPAEGATREEDLAAAGVLLAGLGSEALARAATGHATAAALLAAVRGAIGS